MLAVAVALVVQLFAWAWMPVWSNSAQGAVTSLTAICTSEGMKSILLDENGLPARSESAQSPDGDSPDGKPPAGKAEGHCPLCPLVGGLGLAPVQWVAMPAEVERHGPKALPGRQIATGWFLATLQARAPPALG